MKRSMNDSKEAFIQTTELERKVQVVAELFQDLSFLVRSQQKSIDNIEENLEIASHRTNAAEGELRVARQRRCARRKCLYGICGAMSIAIIIFTVYLSS